MTLTSCPTVCTPQIFINPNLVTVILILIALKILFVKFSKLWFRCLALFIIVLLTVIFTINYNPCGSGCTRQKIICDVSLLPEKSFVNMFLNTPPVEKPPLL